MAKLTLTRSPYQILVGKLALALECAEMLEDHARIGVLTRESHGEIANSLVPLMEQATEALILIIAEMNQTSGSRH
jgi:hypothetical protein